MRAMKSGSRTSAFMSENSESCSATVPETVRPAASYRLYVQMNQLTYLDSPSYTGHWVYPMDESDGNVSILADEGNPATTSTVATSTAAHDSLTSLFASLWSFFENLFR